MSETIDLELLGAFVALAEQKSFTRAAKHLGTTKATVSRSLARLELLVGAELVHRTTRAVALSTAGVALYERAAPHVVALREVARKLPEAADEPSGELRLTAPFDFGVLLLPELLARFALRFPRVRVRAHLTNDLVDLVGGGFDVAIRGVRAGLADSSLSSRRLGPVTLGAYASPSYVARRGTPRDVGDAEHEWGTHDAFARLLSLPRGTTARIVANDFLFLRNLTRAGTCVALLPTFVAASAVATGELVRVLPQLKSGAGKFVLLYPSSGQVARKVRAFRDVAVEALQARPIPG